MKRYKVKWELIDKSARKRRGFSKLMADSKDAAREEFLRINPDVRILFIEEDEPAGHLYGQPVYVSRDELVRDDAMDALRYSMDPGCIKPGIVKPFQEWNQGCSHEWREDQFFTAMKYKTCKKCGKRWEDQ